MFYTKCCWFGSSPGCDRWTLQRNCQDAQQVSTNEPDKKRYNQSLGNFLSYIVDLFLKVENEIFRALYEFQDLQTFLSLKISSRTPRPLPSTFLQCFSSIAPVSGCTCLKIRFFFNFGLFFILFSFLYLKIRWNFDSLPHLSGPNMIVYGVLSVSCRRSRSWGRS